MHGEILLVVLILAVGCTAFFFCAFYVLCRFMAFVGRGVAGMFGGGCGCGPEPMAQTDEAYRVCPREQCRKVERRPARYCSQCGCRLSDGSEHVLL